MHLVAGGRSKPDNCCDHLPQFGLFQCTCLCQPGSNHLWSYLGHAANLPVRHNLHERQVRESPRPCVSAIKTIFAHQS